MSGDPAVSSGPRLWWYVLAVGATLATVAVRLAVAPWVGERPVLVAFFVPIIFSAYFGGLGPGLIATALAGAAGGYFLITAPHQVAVAHTVDEIQWSIMVAGGAMISVLTGMLHRARRQDAATIDRLRAMQATVRENEQRYHTLFDYAPDGILIVDPAGHCHDANPGLCRMLGYAREELLELNTTAIVAAGDAALLTAVAAAGGGTHGGSHPWSLRRKDGTGFEAEVHATNMPDGNRLVVIRDITDRQRGEAARAQLAAIVASSEDAIIGKNLDGVITTWNRGAQKLFGYAPDEIIGRSITTLVPPDRLTEETEILARLRRGDSIPHFATVRRHRDGHAIDVAITISPIRDVAGRVIGASKVARDVTVQKRASDELARERTLLRTLFDLLPDYIYVKDAESRFLACNDRCAARFKLDSTRELIGKTDADIFPPELAAQFRAEELAVLAGVPVIEREEPFVRPDGTREIILTSKLPLRDGAGQIIGLVGCGHDITRRKQAEEAIHRLNGELEQRVAERTAQLEAANAELRQSRAVLVSLFESLPGLYLVLTPDLKIVTSSDAYNRATLTTRAGIAGRPLFEVFPDNPGDPTATGVANLRASIEHVSRTLESHTMAIQKYDIRRPDGVFEERYWSPINSPVLGADRQLLYIIHRVEEVTDFVRQKAPAASSAELRVQMERMEAEIYQSAQKIQETNRQLEVANRELEAFSYSVSHDLRAPLRAVDGFSQAAIEDYAALLPAEGQRQLQTIRESAQRMGALIDDLLKFSRLGRQALSRHRVDMGKLVRSALADLSAEIDGRTLEIKLGELPPCVADPALLRQAWVNLLSNALKYSRRRQPALVEIGCERQGGEAVYFVRDNGTGFDMAYAGKLFGVFQRLHRAEEYEGTGVGLAIVQRVVHRHGGRVWAEAALERGATFYFTLKEEPKT